MDHGLARNYLDPYTVTLAPNGADVAWGEIAWEAWEDLTCAPMDLLRHGPGRCLRDVRRRGRSPADANGRAGGSVARTRALGTWRTASTMSSCPTLAGFQLKFKDAAESRHRFTAMWYFDDTTKPPPASRGKDVYDLYQNHTLTTTVPDDGARFTTSTGSVTREHRDRDL